MVVTDNEDLAWECRSFRDHGYDVKERLNLLAMEEKLTYVHNRVGFNYRMTEIQSIIGIHELDRFDSWNLARRRSHAKQYDEAFDGLRGIKSIPVNTIERQNAYWWYPILLDLKEIDIEAPAFSKELVALGIPCYGIQWPEAYEERAYKEHNGFGRVKFPFRSEEYTDQQAVAYAEMLCKTAKGLRAQTLSLFLHPTWEEVHIQRCIDAVKQILEAHYRS